jgi:SAM-dependent methyltransferase
MVTQDRWEVAQDYERGYWKSLADRIASGSVSQLDWYKWRADELVKRLRRVGHENATTGAARVVEVGCGPIGVVSYFPASRRLAIDPLEEFYGAHAVLSALRNPAVDYQRGVGEDLPAGSGQFDLAIMENCIDHVRDMDAVMQELKRVLTPNGILYLTVNARMPLGFVVHRGLSRMRIDAGHPHTFTRERVRSFVRRNGFDLVDFESESFLSAFKGDIKAKELRPKIKALLGTSEFIVTVIARPRAGAVARD